MRKKRKWNKIVIFLIIITFTTLIIRDTFYRNTTINNHALKIKEKYYVYEDSHLKGNTYYISASGTSKDGTDINHPMSLETAKQKKYSKGDSILFKRGDVYYGQVSFSISAMEDEPCIISSYGEGEKPTIKEEKIISDRNVWQLKDNSIYAVDLTDTNNFEGIKDTDENSCNVGFFTTTDGTMYIENQRNFEDIKKEYDFYCDGTYFYIKSSENPNDRLGTIALSIKKDAFQMSSNTIISNLKIQNTGSNALVKRSYPIKNVYIHDCEISNIGGSFQHGINASNKAKYGNGIEFWNGASNIIIEKNLLKNIYDSAITLQGTSGEWKDCVIRNNITINSCYGTEFWASSDSEGMKNISINNNIYINQGKCWGQQVRPNPHVSANYVFYTFADKANMNISINNNRYYNSLRLFFILYTTRNKFVSEVDVDNNYYYLSESTIAVNDDKYEEMISYLHNQYNVEKNSSFRNLKDSDIDLMFNSEILNSTNYDEIKKYYDDFDVMYRNREAISNIIIANQTVIKNIPSIYSNQNVQNKYTELMVSINRLLSDVDSINQNVVTSLYGEQIELADFIFYEYKLGKFQFENSDKAVVKAIQDIFDITDEYKTLFSYYVTDDNIDVSPTVTNTLNEEIAKYNSNTHVDIRNTTELVEKCKDLYNNSINTESISNNYLNKLRIINTCEIISKIIDYDIYLDDENKIKNNEIYTQNNNLIRNIDVNTTPNTLINNFQLSDSNKVYRNNEELAETSSIATGDILKVNNNTYVLIVKGDIDGNGVVNVADLVKYRKYLLELDELKDLEVYAADTNLDNQLKVGDLVGIRKIILNN